MGRLGVLKPLRGTESSLANVVLEDGEIAFSYPSTGPGTGLGGIKMGDGVKTFSSLPWYITGEGSGPTPTPWEYNTGTSEAALLNNIKYPEYETIGKIYYIQAYWCGDTSSQRESVVSQDMPYMVIGINHDGTENTVDLISLVGAYYSAGLTRVFNYTDGKYTRFYIYNWLSDTCPNGYSSNIQAKMCYMTERWREATGDTSGTMMSRQTKCKLLNPEEIICSNLSSIKNAWDQYINSLGSHYGTIYSPPYQNSVSAQNIRKFYKDKTMSISITIYTNSFLAGVNYGGEDTAHSFFGISSTGAGYSIDYSSNVAYYCPVIRLSDNP